MNPVKEKLNWNYLKDKIELSITLEQNQLGIQVRRNNSIMENLKRFIDDRKIINDFFWGYGIDRLTNGIKVFELKDNPKLGYLLTLFKADKESQYLTFYFIRLNYDRDTISELIDPLELNLDYIEKTSYSGSSELNIYTKQLDKPLKLKIDTVANARYYSGQIPELEQLRISSKEPMKTGLSIYDKSKMVLKVLSEKEDKSGEITEILGELDIDFDLPEIADYAEYFQQTNYAKPDLYKGGCFLRITQFGIDFILSRPNPSEESAVNEVIENTSKESFGQATRAKTIPKKKINWQIILSLIIAFCAATTLVLKLFGIF